MLCKYQCLALSLLSPELLPLVCKKDPKQTVAVPPKNSHLQRARLYADAGLSYLLITFLLTE